VLRIAVVKKLRDFTFSVRVDVPDGVTAVVGASGSGKTTLLRLIAGLLRPESGSVELAGRMLSNGHAFVPPYRRDIGFVFADYALFPHLSVAQNVGYGLRARRYPAGVRRARVRALLERFEIGSLAGQRANELSSGQRQRVALARALAFEPKALLLDEPLSALDPQTRDRVRGELRAILAELTIPTLLVTHDEADRGAFSERVLRLSAGRIVQDGS
jgi:ABC-type sulfate/molybdate transport systems ATPase subunit